MKAAELRAKAYQVLSESKTIKLSVGGESFQFVLKKRTEQDFSDMVGTLDSVYTNAFREYMETPALRQASVRKWDLVSNEELVGAVVAMLTAQRRSLGLDLFDDLNPDEEEHDGMNEDEAEEANQKKLEGRLKEWSEKQEKEVQPYSREKLIGILTDGDAEMHSRLEQLRARNEIVVSQCVYGDDDERVFPAVADVKKLLRTGLLDALKDEVNKFLEVETMQVIREVAQAADFCEPTESEKPST